MQQANKLSADDRSTIRSAVLNARELLESDFERQLERYGILEAERVPLDDIGHLSLQDRETRREIDAAIERELGATEDFERAYRNYVREAAKEYLNRYVGLKTIESRELVTETIATKAEYGNRSYLHYTVDEVAGELTEAADDGFDIALDLAFQEIGAEIRILYENTEYTAIAPDWTVRRDVFEELNEPDDKAWTADEAMGWVYQYFGEKEREEIDDRIDEENYKVQDTDIATKTQLFTPRYIVEWMVDNSLGRLWLEMHGDQTNIDDEDNCFYLAPLEESLIERDVKDVREIKVLDPACGSGHILFYAFDVLYEMYLEQGVVPEKEIPREILKRNLYGIDIDPGAVQIAALALYTKAKERAPDVTIEQINVISADAVLVNGEKNQEVLDRVGTELERRVLEQVWRSFENIREWGSLVRIEERIEEIIEEEREEIENIQAQGQARITGDGEMTTQSSFISRGEEVSWQTLKERLLERVRELAAEALEADDIVQAMFVSEVEKSVELMDYFVGDYDVVVTNPPYLGSGKMGGDLKQYIKDNYIGTRDTYAAFIQRCWEFAGENNYAALVTPENYMFLSSYQKLRKRLIADRQFIEGAHLSGYSFSMKDRPFTIPFVLRNHDPSDFRSSRFYRMTHEQEEYAHYEDKIHGLKAITEAYRSGQEHDDVYVVDQNAFREIRRTPLIYWFGDEILNLYDEHVLLGTVSDIVKGLESGDDDHFLRNWWEIKRNEIGGKYAWLMHGGGNNEYWESTEKTILWETSGEEVRNFEKSYLRNEDYYNKKGITFRRQSKYFVSRIHPQNFLFSHAAHFIHTGNRNHDLGILGYINSSLVRYIMQGINPTMDFQVGDAKNIPIKENIPQHWNDLTKKAIMIRRNGFRLDETKIEFGKKPVNNLDFTYEKDIHESDVQIIHGIIDKFVFDEYDISKKTEDRIYKNIPKNLAGYPHIINIGHLNTDDKEFRAKVPTKELPENEYQQLISEVDDMKDRDLREISEQLEISPYTITMVRDEYNLYTDDEREEAAGRLLSYYLGCVMGRWDLEGFAADENGILVFDDLFEDNVKDHIRECIELTFDDVYDTESELETMLGLPPVEWLRGRFFRYHHTKEYRRWGQRIPIYWQLESNDGTFSCFLYYHAMDGDTLSKLRGQYVDSKLRSLENRLGSLEREIESASEDRKRSLRNELEDTQEQLDDVKDFGERLDALINDGFEPDFEAGIWENIQKVDEYELLQTPLDKL